MRWKAKPEPKLGAKRIKHKLFLFIPLTLQGETRWSEGVSIRQIYSEVVHANPQSGARYIVHRWIDVEWVD